MTYVCKGLSVRRYSARECWGASRLPLAFHCERSAYATHQIVCTIGPATNSEERLEQLIRSGMNVARLNFSHGTQCEHALVIERLRTISARLGCSIAILQDLQGDRKS